MTVCGVWLVVRCFWHNGQRTTDNQHNSTTMKKSMIFFTLATILILLAATVPLQAQTTFTVISLSDSGPG